jgi:hypothetical protein
VPAPTTELEVGRLVQIIILEQEREKVAAAARRLAEDSENVAGRSKSRTTHLLVVKLELMKPGGTLCGVEIAGSKYRVTAGKDASPEQLSRIKFWEEVSGHGV